VPYWLVTESSPAETGAEILWDDYGVPHILAPDHESLFHAFGWAQMQCRAELLLRLYAQARGRAAEYWGEAHLPSDLWVVTMGVPERALAWLEAQPQEFRDCLDAFAAGVNDYAAHHPDRIEQRLRIVLPVSALDVLSHAHRVLHFSFVADMEGVGGLARTGRSPASNAWAIGRQKSESGHPILLCNPHLPWGDAFLCIEAHLVAPGIDAYGIALTGFPVLAMAFNPSLGWAHTVNTHQGWTLYELESTAEGGYILDGRRHSFQAEDFSIRVREDDGGHRTQELVVRKSVHGPVVTARGRLFAVRVAGVDRPRPLHQWWQMAQAERLRDFEAAMAELQVPMFTVVYADRAGHVMHVFNGHVPVRAEGDAAFWRGVVSGTDSSKIWTACHPYRDLPRVLDPPGGWVHSANDPPWTSTLPRVLRPEDYPAYLSPRGPVELRAQCSARLLAESGRLSLRDVARLRFSTRVELACRVLDPLVAAASRSDDALVREGARVLAEWDRLTDPESRGAVLFDAWAREMNPETMFAARWDESNPLSTPSGLADPDGAVGVLARVAMRLKKTFGALDVPWGAVFRLRGDVPATGADRLGTFTELWFLPSADDSYIAIGGDCYTAVVEFSNPVKALVLSTCGNGGPRGAAHADEAMRMFSRKQLRAALLTREEIEARLSARDRPLRETPELGATPTNVGRE
jgi:acyl-homoserine-lactone acylase